MATRAPCCGPKNYEERRSKEVMDRREYEDKLNRDIYGQ